MCLANLIIITPKPSSTALDRETKEKHQSITYSHDQLLYLSKSQLCNNLTGLPPGSIKRIRELKLIEYSINHANLRNLKQVNTTFKVRNQQTKKLHWFWLKTSFHDASMKASLQPKPMYCSRDYYYSSRFNQQYEKPTPKKLQFATINTRSIKPKEDIILKTLNEYKIDLLVTTETWLKDTEDDQQWQPGSELK